MPQSTKPSTVAHLIYLLLGIVATVWTAGCATHPFSNDISFPTPTVALSDLSESSLNAVQEQRGQNEDDGRLITGHVLQNKLGCMYDATCFMRVREANGDEVQIVYGVGRGQSCINTNGLEQGAQIVVGDVVEIFAKQIESDQFSICDSITYYIKRDRSTQ